jgi:hypothetical protein
LSARCIVIHRSSMASTDSCESAEWP